MTAGPEHLGHANKQITRSVMPFSMVCAHPSHLYVIPRTSSLPVTCVPRAMVERPVLVNTQTNTTRRVLPASTAVSVPRAPKTAATPTRRTMDSFVLRRIRATTMKFGTLLQENVCATTMKFGTLLQENVCWFRAPPMKLGTLLQEDV
jgi:hypothetical protein